MADALKDAVERMHASLDGNNEGLDGIIVELKTLLAAKGEKSLSVDKERLPQNNRQGRKMMQTYFKKRGVLIDFAE